MHTTYELLHLTLRSKQAGGSGRTPPVVVRPYFEVRVVLRTIIKWIIVSRASLCLTTSLVVIAPRYRCSPCFFDQPPPPSCSPCFRQHHDDCPPSSTPVHRCCLYHPPPAITHSLRLQKHQYPRTTKAVCLKSKNDQHNRVSLLPETKKWKKKVLFSGFFFRDRNSVFPCPFIFCNIFRSHLSNGS